METVEARRGPTRRRCVMLMFDSLNRHLLPPYHRDTWVHAPNFARLAARSATFETSYVCSMPCMPARRDFHTARPNFLHCAWGPLEPFDDSVPQMLTEAGVYTHLATDHYHYWEDGGATYHNRYSSYELARGQEADAWVPRVHEPEVPDNLNGRKNRHYWANRPAMRDEKDHSQSVTLADGLRFLEHNHADDRWFLQIECFDPHEPFFTHRRYRDLYPQDPIGVPLFDWPRYGKVQETAEQVEACRRNYAALVSKCDATLGDVLDAFDRYGLWEDTMLVVWTDHGFLLGEHGWWAKNNPPLYEEVAHTPLFVWDPRHAGSAGARRKALVQPSIDLGPTLLRFFGLEPTERMLGKDLWPVVERDEPVREHALFGYHGSRVNVTDGQWVYLGSPAPDAPVYSYTLMPTAMRGFKPGLDRASLHGPFAFTKGLPVLQLPAKCWEQGDPGDLLFDVHADPAQQRPQRNEAIEARLRAAMAQLMKECDAPAEQYPRMRLKA